MQMQLQTSLSKNEIEVKHKVNWDKIGKAGKEMVAGNEENNLEYWEDTVSHLTFQWSVTVHQG